MNRIITIIRDEGVITGAVKILRLVIQKSIGFKWQSSLIVVRDMEKPIKEELLKLKPTIDVTFRESTIDDYDMFKEITIHTEMKLKLIREKLLSDDYACIIGVYKGKILFYNWISFVDIFATIAMLKIKLDEKDAYNFDAYSLPEYRKNKLGFIGTIHHMNYVKEKGYKRMISVILEKNEPPRKILHTFGYEILKKVTLVKLFGLNFHINSKPKGPLWPYHK